ncbi:MAG: hypothetical protein AB7O66_11550 [Limisphaerales bacterium]
MRRKSEVLDAGSRNSLEGALYYFKPSEMFAATEAVISAADHLATYQWLVAGLEPLLRRTFVVARLTEDAGMRAQALDLYRRMQKDPSFPQFALRDQVAEGIARCQKSDAEK